jgi:hypothetical protein
MREGLREEVGVGYFGGVRVGREGGDFFRVEIGVGNENIIYQRERIGG